MSIDRKLSLREEQDAFNRQLDSLLKTHEGKYVLFKNGEPVAFFDTHTAAYETALEKFGLDSTFLIAPIEEPNPQPVSIAWDAGVMFG